jgi:hypothetical protein
MIGKPLHSSIRRFLVLLHIFLPQRNHSSISRLNIVDQYNRHRTFINDSHRETVTEYGNMSFFFKLLKGLYIFGR